jgi:hypothetical protein
MQIKKTAKVKLFHTEQIREGQVAGHYITFEITDGTRPIGELKSFFTKPEADWLAKNWTREFKILILSEGKDTKVD